MECKTKQDWSKKLGQNKKVLIQLNRDCKIKSFNEHGSKMVWDTLVWDADSNYQSALLAFALSWTEGRRSYEALRRDFIKFLRLNDVENDGQVLELQ